MRGFAPLGLNLVHTYSEGSPFGVHAQRIVAFAITPGRANNSQDCLLFRPFESPSHSKKYALPNLLGSTGHILVETRGFVLQRSGRVYSRKRRVQPDRGAGHRETVRVFFVKHAGSKSRRRHKKTCEILSFHRFLVETRGFEPLTYALRTHRSTN